MVFKRKRLDKTYDIFSINPFSTNVPLMLKPGSWFLLAKCHSSTGVFQTFCW